MEKYIKNLKLGLKVIDKRIKLNKVLKKQLYDSFLYEQSERTKEETEALETVSKLIQNEITKSKEDKR